VMRRRAPRAFSPHLHVSRSRKKTEVRPISNRLAAGDSPSRRILFFFLSRIPGINYFALFSADENRARLSLHRRHFYRARISAAFQQRVMELIKYLSPHGGWTCEIAKLLASWLKSLGSRARRRENRRALSSVYTASFSIIISIARGKIYCRAGKSASALRCVSIVFSRSFRLSTAGHRENLR